jgi:hypothetical protein
MTTFPSIMPSVGRSYSPGQYQGEIVSYPNGDLSRYRTGNQLSKKTLSLPYQILSTAEKNTIANHFVTHGKWKTFTLPAEIWCYLITAGHPVFPDNSVFLWAEPFSCSANGAGFWQGTANLRCATRMID